MPLIPRYFAFPALTGNEISSGDRLAAFNFCNPFDTVLPFADGIISRTDRAQLWGLYTGVFLQIGGPLVPGAPPREPSGGGVVGKSDQPLVAGESAPPSVSGKGGVK